MLPHRRRAGRYLMRPRLRKAPPLLRNRRRRRSTEHQKVVAGNNSRGTRTPSAEHCARTEPAVDRSCMPDEPGWPTGIVGRSERVWKPTVYEVGHRLVTEQPVRSAAAWSLPRRRRGRIAGLAETPTRWPAFALVAVDQFRAGRVTAPRSWACPGGSPSPRGADRRGGWLRSPWGNRGPEERDSSIAHVGPPSGGTGPARTPRDGYGTARINRHSFI